MTHLRQGFRLCQGYGGQVGGQARDRIHFLRCFCGVFIGLDIGKPEADRTITIAPKAADARPSFGGTVYIPRRPFQIGAPRP